MMRIINKIFRLLFVSALYETKYGIKCTNQLNKFGVSTVLHCLEVDPNTLYLGFDALKDGYTLAGRPLIESPHLEFIECIDKGGDIFNTDYIFRYKKGFLDGRAATALKKNSEEKFNNIFKNRKEEISRDNYNPVMVYRVNSKLYIADGKHRAAFCAYLGKKVKCIEISVDYLNDGYKLWIYQKMMSSRNSYTKNIELFQNGVLRNQKV